jgi:uncharacterized protein (TIGR00375 family)
MATSRDCNPENLQQWAIYKGISLIGTGDFTHPGWREELKAKLEPAEEGLYRLRPDFRRLDEEYPAGSLPVRFVVTGEISSIYKKDGRVHKVHHLLILPSLEAADELSRRLEMIGNIRSDGRPILGLDSRLLLEMMLEACPEALYIPAHIWTPHFSVFGANSGFNSLEECYGDLKEYIYAVETGLSSDPPMNWRLSALEQLTLISNSDAHSPKNLGREANLLNTELSYPGLRQALISRNSDKFLGTLEFFPEEGKYHLDGHRDCQVRWEPAQTRAAAGICPVCKRRVTVGVLHRVEELADRAEGFRPQNARPFESLVPLPEIIAAAIGVGVNSKKVGQQYRSMLTQLGPELNILRETPLEQIAQVGGELLAESIRRMRAGEVEAQPGFDGEYGKIQLLPPKARKRLLGQTFLFEEAELEISEAADFGKPLSPTASNLPDPCPAHKIKEEAPALATATAGVLTASDATAPVAAADTASGFSAALYSLEQPEIISGPNPEQQAVITAEQGPVVVIAGPGTGKTHTLVRRIAYLIQEQKVPPHQITAVTFTNKAAREIRSRLAKLLTEPRQADDERNTDQQIIDERNERNTGQQIASVQSERIIDKQIAGERNERMANDPVAQMNVGTFHSICLDLLRTFLGSDRLLLVLDETDSRRVFAEVIQERDRKLSRHSDKLFRELSFCKSQGLMPASPEISPELSPLYQAYQERLAEYQALDYDDLLLKTVEVFETAPEAKAAALLEQLRQRFSYLLVDEFQDVNPVQYRLVKAWAGTGENTFIIGDPDQAIYGFRGADFRFFGQFQADFPQAQVFQLRLNYRSAPSILETAAAVITPDPKLKAASPYPAKADLRAVRSRQSQIQHWVVPSAVAEGIAICQEINRLIGGATMLQSHGQGAGLNRGSIESDEAVVRGFSEIAVLYRTGRQAAILEECLQKEGIPYRVMGRESFLDNPAVRALLSFLWTLLNPADDFHFYFCLNNPVFGLNQKSIALIRETSRHSGCSAWDAMQVLLADPAKQKTAVIKKLQAVAATIEKYRAQADIKSPQQLLTDWIRENKTEEKQHREGEAIKRLLSIASSYTSLADFLEHLVLAAEADHERLGNSAVGFSEAVTLMTIHAAKGLEYPVVFITGVEDGLIPLKPRKGRQLSAPDLAEERRLFYVGLTRAKDELILLSAKHRNMPGCREAASSQSSVFLQQIPEALLTVRVWEKQNGKPKEGDYGETYQQLRLF